MRKRKIKLFSFKLFRNKSVFCKFFPPVRGNCFDRFILKCINHDVLYHRRFFTGRLPADKESIFSVSKSDKTSFPMFSQYCICLPVSDSQTFIGFFRSICNIVSYLNLPPFFFISFSVPWLAFVS